ncbi:AGAP001117-PA [Anopheles gambiae str. PEST]|uniref:Gustatory receptor n=2 Tax=Anopheles gambiae TaxID=7165 RepID=Q7PKG5_ANOGA|nr:AGAP001117-PA [Anopheles gambiae str. PEST]
MYRRSVAVVMLLNESLNVYSSMEVLYWILRLFGYAPFRLQLDADTPDRDAFGTWRTKLYTISFGLVYTLAFIKFISELKHTGFSASMIEGKGERMYFTFNFFTTMYGVVNGYAVRDKIEKMLYKLHAVDQKISQWKRNVDHRRFYRNVWAGVYLIAIVLLIYIYGTIITCQLHESSCNMQILFVFIYLLFVNSYALMMLQCTAFMEIIRTRYKLINGCFRMYFPTSPSAVGNPSEFAICSEKEQINVLKQIKILHDKLNDVVELVNYCFSVQGKRIGILVHKAINCSSSSAVINEVQCCEGANMMLPVCNVPCAWIILILYLSRQLNLFSQQLLHRSPVITCGLFVYDWTLWYTMIGATATYLIILIQFDVSFPNLVNVNATAVYRGST